jgi:hypothetical protein
VAPREDEEEDEDDGYEKEESTKYVPQSYLEMAVHRVLTGAVCGFVMASVVVLRRMQLGPSPPSMDQIMKPDEL